MTDSPAPTLTFAVDGDLTDFSHALTALKGWVVTVETCGLRFLGHIDTVEWVDSVTGHVVTLASDKDVDGSTDATIELSAITNVTVA